MTPTESRARIAADYTAVRPLPPPAVRALWVTPFAALALFAAPAYFSVRVDATQLGWPVTWGFSIVQVAVGMAVIAVTSVSYGLSPIALDKGWWIVGLVCLGGSAATAMPVVALANVLASRAYPTRPLIMGALFGLGAGLMADAGWRIFCHFSEPAHVLSAHLGGVVASALAGAAIAFTLRKPFR